MTAVFKFFCIFALSVIYVDGHITYIVASQPLEGTPSPPGSPWPMPQLYKPGQKVLQISPMSFDIVSDASSCDVIGKAIKRYRELIFPLKTKSSKADYQSLKVLRLEVDQYKDEACKYPQHEVSENYTLSVEENGKAVLKSQTVWGALRGLETFSQLIYNDLNETQYLINTTSIEDWPRFSFRGILLDTARHFLNMNVLKQTLDAMSYNKMNVFHWHLVDDQSWPYEMKVFPNLTNSAYHPKQIYTQKDIKEIIEYARERGIRVLAEIDTPGHTQAIGKIFPQLLTPCYGKAGRGSAQPPDFAAYEILNPMQNYTYEVITEVLKETAETFPDEYIHLGMDEVYYNCWESSPEIKKFMADNGLKTVSEVEQLYVRRTLDNVKKFGAKYMIWQDPIDNDVKASPDTLVGLWKDVNLDSSLKPWKEYIQAVVKKNYQVVLSAPWYLNYISYGQNWKKYYEVEPTDFEATDEQRKLVVGGEACIWGEYVDATNVFSTLWPRAGAVAERLWSAASVNNTEDAKFRLDEQRCRMVRRGLPASPILNGYCGGYDWGL